MYADIQKFTRYCDRCQKGKKRKRKYGHLAAKEAATTTPWQTVCVDLVGPYTIKGEDRSSVEFMCMTMIDPATGWFEVVELPTVAVYREMKKKDGEIVEVEDEILDKCSAAISQLFNKTWLSRYPRPVEVVCDMAPNLRRTSQPYWNLIPSNASPLQSRIHRQMRSWKEFMASWAT